MIRQISKPVLTAVPDDDEDDDEEDDDDDEDDISTDRGTNESISTARHQELLNQEPVVLRPMNKWEERLSQAEEVKR